MNIQPDRSLLLVAFVLVAGCSDDSSSSTGSGTLTPSGDPKTDLASYIQAECELLDRCANLSLQVLFGDVATCRSRVLLNIKDPAGYEGSTTTTADLVNCVNALKNVDCSVLQGSDPPAACKAKPGTLEDGKGCTESLQCKSTRCKQTGSDCGVCAPKSTAGASCDGSRDCVEGLACIEGAQGNVCGAPVAAGGKCTGGDCIQGYACASGVCVLPEAKAGQPCSSSAQCDTFAGLLCHPLTKVCTAIKPVEAGASCGLVGNDYVVCKGGSRCKMPQGQTSGSCVAPAADGAACDILQDIDCLEPAECTEGVCKLPVEPVCK